MNHRDNHFNATGELICTRCEAYQDPSEYYVNKRNIHRGGKCYSCKTCEKEKRLLGQELDPSLKPTGKNGSLLNLWNFVLYRKTDFNCRVQA